MSDLGKRNADRQAAIQADRTRQKGPADVIGQMREEARALKRKADEKMLADAAQPLFEAT